MDNIFNITNYSDHPVNNNYLVFQFKSEERAQFFEELLNDATIKFEKSEPDESDARFLYAVRKTDRKEALNYNYLVSARYRKPFLPRQFGWLIIVITVGAIALAIAGYMILGK